MRHRVVLLLLVVLLSGCAIEPVGSLGWRIVPLPLFRGPEYSEFGLEFRDTLVFPGNITVPVDHVFGRIRDGDTAAQSLARDYLTPGFTVLAEHGIPLTLPSPAGRPGARQLRFETSWSDWVAPQRGDGTSACAPLTIDEPPENSDPNAVFGKVARSRPPDKCQWQARLTNAYAEFNPLRPKQLKIHARLEVRIRAFDIYNGWYGPRVDARGKNNFQQSLEASLVREYYAYLEAQGVKVESPAFRRFHAQH